MHRPLSLVGIPSSAGAYAPGQEKAPRALRNAGLLTQLSQNGSPVRDLGDTAQFRWKPDKESPFAMNPAAVADAARAAAARASQGLDERGRVLVLGGDCSVELGTVAAARTRSSDIGLVYIDLDADMNTPSSTTDGAIDWMGVAHLLGLPNCLRPLVELSGSAGPMLRPDQILLFGTGNTTAFEQENISSLDISTVPLATVEADPIAAASRAAKWANEFEVILVHLDVDILDFAEMPLAENTRRNVGLKFDQLDLALSTLLKSSDWDALTVTEVNPDHDVADGSTLRKFTDSLAAAISGQP